MYNNPSSEIVSASIDDLQSKEYQERKISPKLLKLMEMDNIAPSLDEQELIDISSLVKTTYEIDKATREKWEETMDEAYKLIDGGKEVKNNPWPKASNVKFPMITEACIQFNARIGPEITRDDTVVEVRVEGEDDAIPQPQQPGQPQQPPPEAAPQQQMGESQGPMGAPQPPAPQPEPDKESDRGQRLSDHMSYQLLAQSTHWESDTDRLLMILPMVGTVYRKSFFNTITGHPDTELCLPSEVIVNNNVSSLETALRITHKKQMSSNQLLEAMAAGIFTEYTLDELAVQAEDLDAEDPKTDSGKTDPIPETDGKHDIIHDILEQHRFLDLDGDGYQEPYIVTRHDGSGKVLRIVARYDEESIEFNEEGKFIRINPDHYFTDFHFIPNPDGSFHSYGFGLLLLQLNASVNSILNQLIDAGTLANRQSGFIGDGLRLPSGKFSFMPGEWKKVKTPIGGNIGSNIFPLPVKEPSQALLALMNFLIEAGRTLTSISDVMQGETPAANTPAATTMALVEQGQKIFSAILKRIYRALKKEFTKLYEINKKYMGESETFPLAVGSGMVTIQDYQAVNFGIYPVADPNLSSWAQRIAQARALLELLGRPEIRPLPILKNYLKTLRVQNIDEILIETPPPPSPAEILELKGKAAEVKMAELQPAFEMMDREHKTIELGISEAKQQAETAYFGVQAAEKKINSAVALTESEAQYGEAAVNENLEEGEKLSQLTKAQDFPMAEYQRLDQLEGETTQTLEGIQQAIEPQQSGQTGQEEGPPPLPPEQQPDTDQGQ